MNNYHYGVDSFNEAVNRREEQQAENRVKPKLPLKRRKRSAPKAKSRKSFSLLSFAVNVGLVIFFSFMLYRSCQADEKIRQIDESIYRIHFQDSINRLKR